MSSITISNVRLRRFSGEIFINLIFVLDLFDDVIEVITTRVPEPIWSSNQRPTLSWQENERTAIESWPRRSASAKPSNKLNISSSKFSNNKRQPLQRSRN